MRSYLDLMRRVRDTGFKKSDRTGTGTLSLFGERLRFDLSQGFPLVTTKRIFFKGVVHELLWFLKGETNTRTLKESGVHFWNDWASETGDLGPIYGKQWRSWETSGGETIDQIQGIIEQIRTNPDSRRLVVTAWNPSDLPEMALSPCHCLFQFYVADGKISCQLYQRSGDLFLGVPFNIASYALLTHMIAHVTGLKVGDFVHVFGDVHLYLNHLEQVESQLEREPKELPAISLSPKVHSIDDFAFDDIRLENYAPHPRISAQISV